MADEQMAEAYRRYEMRLNEARFLVDNTYKEWNEAKPALLSLQVNREAIIRSMIREEIIRTTPKNIMEKDNAKR